jgi:hypothetical protein
MNAPNPLFEGTAEKLRFSVPSGLRPPAAPQLKCYSSLAPEIFWRFGLIFICVHLRSSAVPNICLASPPRS